MKCVIMAGGRGTRISSLAPGIPKPMIKINEKPILEYEIEKLREQGIREFIITVGYLATVIMDYFGDGSGDSPVTGKCFGVKIDYYVEEKPLGNAGALFALKDVLKEDFLLVNGDCIFDVDIKRFLDYHRDKCGIVTLFTHPNSHPYDSELIVSDNEGAVVKWFSRDEERPKYYKNRVNAGLHIVSGEIFNTEITADKIDLDRDLLKPLAGTGKMYAYESPEYVKDMGTPERFNSICCDLERCRIGKANLGKRQKAIFIDRDGTINQYCGFLKCIENFELLPKTAKAVRLINDSEYLAIVVTNQPVVARGELSLIELEEIHCKMETLLGEQGAYLDDIYVCPHHPHKGYEGERTEYKIECNCRKPKPGMLLQAAEKYNIDLSCSWMVGDSESDILAGKAAGCRTAYIGEENFGQDIQADNLYNLVLQIMAGSEERTCWKADL